MSESNVVEAPEYSGPEEFEGGGSADDGGGSDGDGSTGQGQSKSSRRRRRKRRNKLASQGIVIEGGADDAGESPTAESSLSPMEGESLAARKPAQQVPPATPNGNVGPAPQGTGTGKRWKKKFRDRERRPRNENPGNEVQPQAQTNGGGSNWSSNGQGGGFKRKGKSGGSSNGGGRKDRSFVGPMDHSYREANGNFADPSASTIQVHGARRSGHRHHGDAQPVDHSMPRAIPLPANAQTHIYLFVEDLFVTAKVQETARKQGVKVAFVKNDKESLAELMADRETDKPGLIVIDLNNVAAKPMTLIPKLKTKFKKSVSIIGFLSHIQGDLKAKATEVGCDTVMPKAAFSTNLPNLLRRYGADEEEEQNFNH